jgi:hypothetical protein
MAGILILVGSALAGCSSNNGSDATSAISGAATTPSAAVAGSTQQAAPLVPALPPVENATCEELKTELTALGAEKIPQKLAQFGQSKYTPTPDESAKFTRYVEVNQASKARCKTATADPAPAKKKQKTAAATVNAPAAVTTEKKKKVAAKKVEQPAAVAAATQTVAKKKPAVTAAATATSTGDDAGTTPLIGTQPSAVSVDADTQGVTTTIIPD